MKCSVVVRAGCVLLSPRFLERTGIPGAMLVKIRTPAEARGWDKSRTPTDHELPRGFPGGGFAMSTLGIKERHHEDASYRGPGHGRAAMSHARRGRNVDLRKGETSIGMKMAATRRGEMASESPSVGGCPRLRHTSVGRWVSTTLSRDFACSEPGNSCSAPCRWVG